MFSIFKKKKTTTAPDPQLPEKDSIEEQDDTVSYFFSKTALPNEHQHRRVSIDYWEKSDGDFVKKGEHLGEFSLENEDGVTLNIDAEVDGFIEIFKESSKSILHPKFLIEKEKVFSIYVDPIEQKIIELKNKRYKNIALIKENAFSGAKEIKWESVAGRKKVKPHDTKIYDSFIFFSDDGNSDRFIFTINNIDNKDYIVFKYLSKDYKLTVGSIISFLFNNQKILEFEIMSKPYKHSEHYDWGHIFETKAQLTAQELEVFKTKSFLKWQIDIAKTGKKITGVIDSEDTQFSVNKLAIEYDKLVQSEIADYQPLTNKEESLPNITPNNEVCYVYLMIDLTNKFHKIGISNKPEYREKTLQSEKPTIEMLCNKRFPNRKIANSFEQALHHAYADKRVRGEWFELTSQEVQELTEALTT